MRTAVVMAAGEGSRLRPLTARWPKPVLPIDGRPVIATLLRELAAGGVTRVYVITGHLAEQVEELVGDGSAFGVEAIFARQPGVLGSADAVQRALAAGAAPPFLVTAADTVYTPGDTARISGNALAVVHSVEGQRVDVEDGRVVRVRGEGGPFAAAPLWGVGPELVPFLDGLPGPPIELADAAQRAIDAGIGVAAVEIGPTRDLTRPVDLVEENFPYLSR